MARICWMLCALWLALPCAAAATDRVAASERVQSSVIVREAPDAKSAVVGRLRPGDEAQHLDGADGWNHIELEDGTRGYASARWTIVVPAAKEPEPPAPEPTTPIGPVTTTDRPIDRPPLLRRMGDAVVRAFRGPSAVDFHIVKPILDEGIYQHWEPTLPVSGLATTLGSTGLYDIMLVLDASTSANEYALGDVDGDGRTEDEWRGDDSIFQAEVEATRQFVRALGRLPGNNEGQRIRVGVLTFAGDERLHRHPDDEEVDTSPDAIVALAERDATLRIALTHDYAAVDRTLGELARFEPVGMTDVAAGLGLAIVELRGMTSRGARSERREGAERIVHFLTDGAPSLPFDVEVAELTAEAAARLAARSNVRVNVFQIGLNPVTLQTNPTMPKLAHWTGGEFTELENPGDIVALLEATSLTYVDRVKLVNRTTEQQSDYIATGIDGSFYGEVALREGSNEIAVLARLPGKRQAVRKFSVVYRVGPPREELQARLREIRQENEVLIEEIKKRLSLRMERERRGLDPTERERQEKDLALDPEVPAER